MPLFHQWDAENIYLILEWCSGGDLSRFIRSRRILPERVARRFLQQMGQSLQVSFIDFFFFLFRGSLNTFLEPNKHEHCVEKPVELTFMVERHTHFSVILTSLYACLCKQPAHSNFFTRETSHTWT